MRVVAYRARTGFYSGLDERARVLFSAGGVAAALCTWDALPLAVTASTGLALVALARVRWSELRNFALFAGVVIALLVFATWFVHGGDPAERRAHALAQSLRMTSLVAFTAVLPFTIAPSRWGITFARLGLPDRLAYAVELSFRFVPSFARRFERTLLAQRARGLDASASAGPLRRIARLVPILVPVLLDSIVAGEDVADALDLRAFGTGRRTWSGPGKFGAAEWGTTAAGAALVALVFLL